MVQLPQNVKSHGLMGPKKLHWMHLLAKVTLPVPAKQVSLRDKTIMFQVNTKLI